MHSTSDCIPREWEIYIYLYIERGGRERESERETNNRKVLKKRVYIYNIDKRWSTALNPMFTA